MSEKKSIENGDVKKKSAGHLIGSLYEVENLSV